MSTHSSSSDSLSSTSLLLSPSTTSSPRPNYGWDQVRDILDSSSSSNNHNTDRTSRQNAHTNDAYDRELDLAMVDLTPDEKRKLSLLMKDEYQRKNDASDSDEEDEESRRDLEELFRTPKLIHGSNSSITTTSPKRLNSGSPRRSRGSLDGKLSSRSTPLQSPNYKSPSMKRRHPSRGTYNSPSSSLKRTPHSRPSSTTSSPGFTSPFSSVGFTSSSPNIEEWIGIQWSSQRRERDTTFSSRPSPQKQSGGKVRRKKQSPSMQSPILSPPPNTSILSVFQSTQDTLDAALNDVNETLRQSAKQERRAVVDEGEMTPDFFTPRGGDGDDALRISTLRTWKEEGDSHGDGNLAMALDFDLVAREEETAGRRQYIEGDEESESEVNNEKPDDHYVFGHDNQLIAENTNLSEDKSMLEQDPNKSSPVSSTDTTSETRGSHMIPTPSPHPEHSDDTNLTTIHTPQSDGTRNDERTLGSSESVKPNHSIPIPSPQPIHPNLIATHTSSFDNVTNDTDEEELTPSNSIPMPSPQPIRPDLSGRSKAFPSRIPRLPPQDRGTNDATTDIRRQKKTSLAIGKRSKVHPGGTEAGSVAGSLKPKSLKPRESLKSSVKAMLNRSNSYSERSSGQVIEQKSESKDQKKNLTNLQSRQRSSSDAGDSSKRSSRLQFTSSYDSHDRPSSTTSQQSSLLQRKFSSGSDSQNYSLDASSSPSPTSRRSMEYDAILRASKADKSKSKHGANKIMAERHSNEVEKEQDMVESLATVEQLKDQNDQSELTEECVNDVVDLVSESLDVSHVIYEDDLEAVVAADMDESFEFEAAEKLCSEVQSPLLHLQPRISEFMATPIVGAELLTAGVNETDETILSEKYLESAVSPIVMSSDSPSNERKETGDALPQYLDSISEKAEDILSLCVDGQLLAEEEDLFYDAHAFLYRDNYDDVTALETEESRVFAENELQCSGASMMYGDAARDNSFTPSSQSNLNEVASNRSDGEETSDVAAAKKIQKSYRTYQTLSAQVNELDLDKCSLYLEPKLAVCVDKMQEILLKHRNELNAQRGTLDAAQKRNYLDLYDDLMSIFNSKIREMQMKNLSCDASAIVNVQQCIRTSHVRKDFHQLQQNLQTLQTHISHNVSHKSADVTQALDTSSEIKRYHKGQIGMVSLQARVRGSRTRRQIHSMAVNLVKLQSLARMQIQLRRYKIHTAAIEQFKLSQYAATKLQSCIRAMLKHNQFVTVKRSVVIFQRIVRKRFSLRRLQVIRIQALLRGVSQRQRFSGMRNKLSTLQAQVRGFLAREKLGKMKHGVKLIQSFGRMVIERSRFHLSTVSVTVLQAAFRGHVARQFFSDLMQVKLSHSAAIKLQSFVLSALYHVRYIRFKQAVLVLQKRARAVSVRRDYQVARIQACARRALQRRLNVKIYCSAAVVQAQIRGSILRRQFIMTKKAVQVLQSYARMAVEKDKFHKFVCTVIALQAIVRGVSMRRSHFQARAIHFRQRRTRIVKLQATIRSFTTRLHFKKAISGAISIQSQVRCMQQKNDYKRMYKAALMMQSSLRSTLEKRRYHRLLHGIILFQATVRGKQNKLLVCSKVAASVAWNDIMITSDKTDLFHESGCQVSDFSENNVNNAAVRLQSLWRAFRDKIKVAKKLLLSWRMDCYYPSHIKNKMSFLRAGKLYICFIVKADSRLYGVSNNRCLSINIGQVFWS